MQNPFKTTIAGPLGLGVLVRGRGPVNLKSALLPMLALYVETPVDVNRLQTGFGNPIFPCLQGTPATGFCLDKPVFHISVVISACSPPNIKAEMPLYQGS